MKRLTGILMALLAVCLCAYAMADTAIDPSHFPDTDFRTFVQNYDTNHDGNLNDSEIASVHIIECDGLKLSSLKGIEYFTALKELNCSSNLLTELDICQNTALKVLYCYDNKLSTLDISHNTALYDFNCALNQITGLDLSKNQAMITLDCANNQIATLNLSSLPNLKTLIVSDNKLKALDISANPALTHLQCQKTQITDIDTKHNPALKTIKADHNQLTKIDITENPLLEDLDCSGNQLTGLDLSKNSKLNYLCCDHNKLKYLDVSPCPILAKLAKGTRYHADEADWDYWSSSNGFLRVDTNLPVYTEASGVPGDQEENVISDESGTFTVSNSTATFSAAADHNAETLSIPDQVSDNAGNIYKITAIDANACKGMTKLTLVSIGKNVKTIGKNAFAGCTNLKTVQGCAAVTTIMDAAFSGCRVLKTVPAMSKLQKIGAGAFRDCVKMKKFTLGKAVKAIGKNAFNGCKSLKTITVKTTKLTGSNVKSNAFKGINKKATFKCPKKMLKAYKKLLIKRGAPKTCKFK